jgi:hypothetical protein
MAVGFAENLSHYAASDPRGKFFAQRPLVRLEFAPIAPGNGGFALQLPPICIRKKERRA